MPPPPPLPLPLLLLLLLPQLQVLQPEQSASSGPGLQRAGQCPPPPPPPRAEPSDADTPADGNYSLFYNYLADTGAHNFANCVTLGFLGAYGSAPVELGALPLAVRAVNADPALLPGRRLNYLTADIGAGPRRRDTHLAARAIRFMTEMRDKGAVAFIGPGDSCTAEALVAAAWDLPMISYKCADTAVSDKNVYFTFARTLPPSSKVSKSVVALLRAFRWSQFAVVAGSRPAWGAQVLEALKWLDCRPPSTQLRSPRLPQELSRAHGLQLNGISRFGNSDYISTESTFREMEEIVGDTFERTRVYVFVGEHIALVDFVNCLQRRGLLQRGEYAVISVDDEVYDPTSKLSIVSRAYLDPYLQEGAYNAFRDIAAFRSVLKLTPTHPRNPRYKQLCEQIRNLSAQPPFHVPYNPVVFDSISVPMAAAHLYDAVMIYAHALTEALQAGEDPHNGSAILRRVRNRPYRSVQGHDVMMDENADAEGNYTVMALLDDAEVTSGLRMSMQPVGFFWYPPAPAAGPPADLPEFRYLNEARPIQWVGGAPPPAEPPCGFRGERCARHPDWRLALTLAALAALLLAAAGIACRPEAQRSRGLRRHYRYEQKLACLLWKVDMRDVTLIPVGGGSGGSGTDSGGQGGGGSGPGLCRGAASLAAGAEAGGPKRAYTTIGLYKGSIVAVKRLRKRSVDLTRSIRKELQQVREARHENLLAFIGASVDSGQVALLAAYCARGSLQDVLANADVRLDAMFVSSLVSDLLKGLIYLHDSDIVSHGNLRSSNCLVDSRWVLQIADFGLHEFKAGQEGPEEAARERRRRLWRAPELLRAQHPPARGSQKGDVYSFGIVLYEMVGRAGPWGRCSLSDSEIAARVREPPPGEPVLRPDTAALPVSESVRRCLESCWDEEPDARPDIRFVRVKLKEMQAGLKPNIFDNMLAMMEKHADNLEALVQERTRQLSEEKKKTDALLHRMLPKTVAEALKRGERVPAESFDCVTIFFSDIVGFTELSAVSTPWQVVDLLNDLYTCCDSIISHYDVYKVETIGDAYMVASGLPLRNGDRHAGEVASMALHLLARMRRFRIRHRPGQPLRLRIGVHSGHCVAGVVGLKMPRYCLFGDTVNTASRMESSGEPGRIHVSESTHALLQRLGGYECEERGLTHIKATTARARALPQGKGAMRTYWLLGEDEELRLARLARLGAADWPGGAPHGGAERLPDLLCSPAAGGSAGEPPPPPPLLLALPGVPACRRSAPAISFREH